jgi:hypothetical protein
MAETANLGLVLLEAGQGGKELVVNANMALIDTALPAPLTLPLALTQGGTGATTAAGARTALALGALAVLNAVPDASITYAKIQNLTDVRLLGRSAGSGGPPQELTVGTGLSLSGGVLSSTVSGGLSDTLNRPNTGLSLLDTNASHALTIAPGSDLTAARTLTLTTGDANRTLTLTGNATLNQDVSTVGSPTLLGLTLGVAGATLGTLALAGNTSGTVTVRPAAAAGTWTLTLPADDGDSGDVLRTDGAGVTTWVAPKNVVALTDAATVTAAVGADGRPYLGLLATLSQATTFANPTGTPSDGQFMAVRIVSSTARALAWGAAFKGSTALPLPTTTTGSSLRDYFGFEWCAATSTWDYLAGAAGIG